MRTILREQQITYNNKDEFSLLLEQDVPTNVQVKADVSMGDADA